MTRSGWVWPWVGVSLAVSCALPELTVGEGDDSGGGEGAEGGSGLASGTSGSGKGGNTSGGSSGDSSGGSGKGGSGKGGTDTGGSGAEGGTAGNSGGTDTGGTDGTGGQGGSMGGGGSSGKGGTSTGGSAGMGGGGTGTGGAGKGGTGGAGRGGAGSGGGGAGGKGGAVTIPELVGALDGYLVQFPCDDNPATDDCNVGGVVYNGVLTRCAGGQLAVQHDFPIGGTPGAAYLVTMHFYGIVGAKNYGTEPTIVLRDAGTGRPGNQNSGASPTPWASAVQPTTFTVPGSTYETSEIQVFNQLGTSSSSNRVGFYFLNADTMEPHITYVLNFSKTIPVVGGGTIRMRHFDSNCRQIKNCGATSGVPCGTKVRTVDITAASPQPVMGLPPAGFTQPGLGEPNDHAGQWLLADVTAVSPM